MEPRLVISSDGLRGRYRQQKGTKTHFRGTVVLYFDGAGGYMTVYVCRNHQLTYLERMDFTL